MRSIFLFLLIMTIPMRGTAQEDSLYIDFTDLLDEGFPVESISEISFSGSDLDTIVLNLTDNSQRFYNLDEITELTFSAPPGYTVPVELVSLFGRMEGAMVYLNWSTQTETNNSGFEVQQYRNGKWQELGFVHGKGTTTESQSYTFNSEVGESDSFKFRLKQVDLDGSFRYSAILILDATPMVFSLSQNYPNPFNPTTTIVYQVPKTGIVKVELFDILGRQVFKQTIEVAEAGSHQMVLDANQWGMASGTYILTLVFENKSYQKRISLVK